MRLRKFKIVSVGAMAVFSSLLFVSTPTTTAAAAEYTADMIQYPDFEIGAVQDEAAKYIKSDGRGLSYFDVYEARDNQVSAEVMTVGLLFNDMSYPDGSKNIIPNYGNWCGPGHSGPAAPIDVLDQICQRHDQCYARRGYDNCSCDEDFRRELRDNRSRINGWAAKAYAAAAELAFRFKSCK